MSSSTSRRQVLVVAVFLSGCCSFTPKVSLAEPQTLRCTCPSLSVPWQLRCAVCYADFCFMALAASHSIAILASSHRLRHSVFAPCFFPLVLSARPCLVARLGSGILKQHFGFLRYPHLHALGFSCTRIWRMSVPHSLLHLSCSWRHGQMIHCSGRLLTRNWRLASGLSGRDYLGHCCHGRAEVDSHLVSTITVTCP
jgi:hypothetical protein